MVATLKSVGQETIFFLIFFFLHSCLLVKPFSLNTACLPHREFVLQEGILKKRLYFCGLRSSNVCQPTPTSKHFEVAEKVCISPNAGAKRLVL